MTTDRVRKKAPHTRGGAVLALSLILLSACAMGPDFPEPEKGFAPVARHINGVNWVSPSTDLKPELPFMVFVHGTPGDWSGFSWYLADAELGTYFNLIAPDRPGFGSTKHAVMPQLRDQAQMLLDAMPTQQTIWVTGHSLGAPLALWMALLAPERVQGVVLLAGSIDAAKESPRWFNHLADTVLAGWLLPAALRRSNEEIMTLQSELEQLEKELPALRAAVLSIQGEKDQLVHPESPDLLHSVLSEDTVVRDLRWPNAGHFLLWDAPERVRDAIVAFHLTESDSQLATE